MITNRRNNSRLRLHSNTKIPIYLAKSRLFSGPPIMATSINISTGGMALRFDAAETDDTFKIKKSIKIHFRLPGKKTQVCTGKILHKFSLSAGFFQIGIRFTKIPKKLKEEIEQMTSDNDFCDSRIKSDIRPLCLSTCSFRELCRKPIRVPAFQPLLARDMEISLKTSR